MHVAGWVAFTVGWLKGGHPERFGVAVLMFGQLIEIFVFNRRSGEISLGLVGTQAVLLLIFGRQAFRSNRWWPLAVTGCLTLILLVYGLATVTSMSAYAAVSAEVGLWLLLHLILLAGVAERWLAGEAAVSRLGRDAA